MGCWTLILAVKFFAFMTSFRGGTAGSKSAGYRNLEICHSLATEEDRETKSVSNCAKESISFNLLRDLMAVF